MLQVLLSRVESFLSRAQQDANFTGILFLIVLFSFFSRQEKVLEKKIVEEKTYLRRNTKSCLKKTCEIAEFVEEKRTS